MQNWNYDKLDSQLGCNSGPLGWWSAEAAILTDPSAWVGDNCRRCYSFGWEFPDLLWQYLSIDETTLPLSTDAPSTLMSSSSSSPPLQPQHLRLALTLQEVPLLPLTYSLTPLLSTYSTSLISRGVTPPSPFQRSLSSRIKLGKLGLYCLVVFPSSLFRRQVTPFDESLCDSAVSPFQYPSLQDLLWLRQTLPSSPVIGAFGDT